MAKRLLVEGLDWGVTEGQLMGVFAPFGELDEARIVTDWETGRSRGFGYVTFRDSGDAESALTGLDGQKLAGKTLRVMVAPDQVPGRPGSAPPPPPEARPVYRGGDYGYIEAEDTRADQPRTDRRLFRSADFGYVDKKVAPPLTPKAKPAEEARPAVAKAPAPKKAAKIEEGRPTPGSQLDDEEQVNRAKYGGWNEREDNDQGRGGGGSPFG